MTKRDRIATVLTVAWGIFGFWSLSRSSWDFLELLVFWGPIIGYWGYRFINKSE